MTPVEAAEFLRTHDRYPERAACGEIIYEIAVALGQLTAEAALPRYVAVSTDTGGENESGI